MGIIPVADTINGTTYSALCFHMFFTFIARSWYCLHYYYYYKLFDLCMVDLTVLLVAHCHIECQTIGLSIIGRAGDERN